MPWFMRFGTTENTAARGNHAHEVATPTAIAGSGGAVDAAAAGGILASLAEGKALAVASDFVDGGAPDEPSGDILSVVSNNWDFGSEPSGKQVFAVNEYQQWVRFADSLAILGGTTTLRFAPAAFPGVAATNHRLVRDADGVLSLVAETRDADGNITATQDILKYTPATGAFALASPTTGTVALSGGTGGSLALEGDATKVGGSGQKLSFLGVSPIARPTVSGSRGANAALASLLTALQALGLITDGTS